MYKLLTETVRETYFTNAARKFILFELFPKGFVSLSLSTKASIRIRKDSLFVINSRIG